MEKITAGTDSSVKSVWIFKQVVSVLHSAMLILYLIL